METRKNNNCNGLYTVHLVITTEKGVAGWPRVKEVVAFGSKEYAREYSRTVRRTEKFVDVVYDVEPWRGGEAMELVESRRHTSKPRRK